MSDFDREFEEVISEAIRPMAREAGIENLITMHLFRSIYTANLLEKIRLIFEAFMIILNDREKLDLIDLHESEVEMIKKLYRCCIDLMNIEVETIIFSPIQRLMRAIIPWSFNFNEAKEYLEFWIDHVNIALAPLPLNPEEIKSLRKIYGNSPLWMAVYDLGIQGLLHPTSAKIIVNQFINYSMPIACKIMRELIENVVSPDVWWETLKIHAQSSKTFLGESKNES